MSAMKTYGVAILALVGSRALAYADASAEAQLHIDKATLLYKETKFEEAITELNAAYALEPQPQLLYAIGQIEVKLGRCADAEIYYKRFVDSKPEPDAVAATKEAIETCKAGPATPPVPGTPTPTPTPATPPAATPAAATASAPAAGPQWYDDHLADALMGGGIASELLATVLYLHAQADLDAADRARTYGDQQQSVDSAHTARAVSVVLAIGGLALAGAGAYRYVFLHDVEASGVIVAPTTGGATVTWTTRF